MATKNQKTKDKFPEALIREWENSDGVDFAIALARATGWLLHVDWWAENGNDPEEKMQSLRVYVGTDGDAIYDFNGKKRIQAYNEYTIKPLLAKRKIFDGGVLTRYYSEEKIWNLPLRVKPSEVYIAQAAAALCKHPTFLSKIPNRINPEIPAHLAADFTFGKCVVFAAVLQEVSGAPAFAINVQRYTQAFSLSKTGYCHSVVVHPDGFWEDAWGVQAPKGILERYGIDEYTLNEETQQDAVTKLLEDSKELYSKYEELARELLALKTR